jgi:GTPase SAR1 family protein
MSMEKIKITMLGSSGSGKTCYMVAMYKMMSLGIDLNGFTLSACDADDNVRFGELWTSLVDTKGTDRWPAPTGDETSTYKFNFNYSFRPLLGFDWFDYRGGAIQDYSAAPDVDELRNRLIDTSCIFLCVSGEHFSTRKPKISSYEKIGVSAINQLMADAQNLNKKNTPPAIVIVITKYDLCSHRPKADIISDIRKMFGVFFGQGTKWLVMLCPVTLGEEFAVDSNEAEVDPQCVHLPVIFAMYAELLRKNWELDARIKENNVELIRLQKGILSQWIQKNNIIDTNDDTNFLRSQLQEIQHKMFLLSSEFRKDNITLFFNGREVRISDFFL